MLDGLVCLLFRRDFVSVHQYFARFSLKMLMTFTQLPILIWNICIHSKPPDIVIRYALLST